MTDEDPHPMEYHRETMPEGEGTTIVEGEWLWASTFGPEEFSEVPGELFPNGLTGRNAAWVAEECKALLGVPNVWAFVPESPHSADFRTDRLVLAAPSNIYLLRQTRVGGKDRRWEWRWHGPTMPETEHGVLDMVEREWVHVFEGVTVTDRSAERTMRSQTAQTLWDKLRKEGHESLTEEVLTA